MRLLHFVFNLISSRIYRRRRRLGYSGGQGRHSTLLTLFPLQATPFHSVPGLLSSGTPIIHGAIHNQDGPCYMWLLHDVAAAAFVSPEAAQRKPIEWEGGGEEYLYKITSAFLLPSSCCCCDGGCRSCSAGYTPQCFPSSSSSSPNIF